MYRRSQLYIDAKRRARKGDLSRTDRLSNLPDSVLYRILSLLDTKSVVQTCVLSRQWRCVWKHVPAFELDISSFDSHYEGFNSSLDKVFSLHYPTDIDKISCYPTDSVLKVFEYAASHRTRHLVLQLRSQEDAYARYRFPQSHDIISDCNLESLELSGFAIDDQFASFGFLRSLTTLKLVSCVFESDDPFSKLPCLKSLSIDGRGARYSFGKRLRIDGVQLHSLKLERMDFCNVEITCAPKLKSLALVDDEIPEQVSQLALSSLDHADVRISDNFTKENALLMLRPFRNVKSLTLGRQVIKVLCEDFEFLERQPSGFTRLEKLNLKLPMNSYIPTRLLMYFLRSSSYASAKFKIV